MTKKVFWLIVTIIIALLVFVFAFYKLGLQDEILKLFYKTDYKQYVEKYSEEYDVDKYLIYALIKNESNFKNDATSNKKAKGLMQIIDSTANEVAQNIQIEHSEIDLYHEETNIKIGTKYLSQLLEKYDSYLLAIAAYNAGIGNVDSWIEKGTIKSDGSNLENIPYPETNHYVRKVARDYDIYKEIYRRDV